MSLSDSITEARETLTRPCKTCDALQLLTPQDRADFAAEVKAETNGSLIAKGIARELAKHGHDAELAPSEATVRKCIAKGHRVPE